MRPSYRHFLFAVLPLAATASWQAVGQAGTDSRPDPRTAALGTVFWADSARYDLFSLAGNPIGLLTTDSQTLSLHLRSAGTSFSGGGAQASDNHPGSFELRTSAANRYGMRLGIDYETQTLQEATGLPKYQASRFRWGFDVSGNLVGARFLTMGFGLHGRIPSNQTQDTSGTGASGKFERWQPALDVIRLSLGSRIADMVTVSGRIEASALADSMNHTPSGNALKTLNRFGRVVAPFWGVGAQLDNPTIPVRAVTEFGAGTAYRIGVVKTIGTASIPGTNVDMPQLTTDTSRFLIAAIGRIDQALPEHVFKPALAFFTTSSKTQAFQPIAGAQALDFYRKNAEMTDTNWTYSSVGFALGLGYEWIKGVKSNLEWERTGLELSRGAKLDSGKTDKHADHRVSMGVEVAQTVIPALAAKFPEGTSACLRLGLRMQSLAGYEVEPGFLSNLTTGYEPFATGYKAGWKGQEAIVGLDPQLGGGSDETAISVGLGGTFLNGKVGVDAALVFDSWKSDNALISKMSGTGWNLGVHWSL